MRAHGRDVGSHTKTADELNEEGVLSREVGVSEDEGNGTEQANTRLEIGRV